MNIFNYMMRRWRGLGHGIQSPAAYSFVRYVLCERDEYYAYSEIDKRAKESGGSKAYWRFLFRLANFWQADEVFLPAGKNHYAFPIGEGCKKTKVVTDNDFQSVGKAAKTIVIIDKEVDNLPLFLFKLDTDCLLIVENIKHNESMQQLWKEIVADGRVTRSYDVLQFGVAFFGGNRLKEHFEVSL